MTWDIRTTWGTKNINWDRKPKSAWTEERVALLRQLWPLPDWSASMIAAELNCGLSRMAVIGKARRLGLELSPETRKTKASVPRPRHPRHRPVKRERFKMQISQAPEPLPPPAVAPDCDPVSFINLQPHHCRYIPDDPAGERTMYCGAPKVEGSPYCEFHAELTTKEVRRLPFIPTREAA